MQSDRSDRLTPIKRFVLRHKGDSMILKAMARGSQPMVSKPVGVRTTWCVGVGIQDMIPRTQPGKLAVFKAALQSPWPMTGHKENTTVHEAKDGKVIVPR